MTAPVHEGDVLAGKYRVDRVLGAGGMGVVVAATDQQLERRVAIKFLLPEYVQHGEAAARFLREARAAVKIHSEHVARVIDVGTLETGAPYMVMEYLEGTDLSGVIAQRGRLPVDEAVLHVLEACEAIAEAHAAGIIHRDLKPANLFLARRADGSSQVKVLDFGISKTTIGLGDQEMSLTKTSSIMGSPLYMSPEQMRSSRDVDARTDIWSLGAILYELLAGEPPFNGESMTQLVAVILQEPVPSLRERRPDVAPELEAIILRALEKDPARRFTTVGDFAVALVDHAPRRGRLHAERITRVLRAAGLSTSQLEMPSSVGPKELTVATTAITTPTAPGAQTAAAWGQTHGPERRRRNSLVIGLVALGLVSAVGASALVVAALRAGPTGSEELAPPSAAPAPPAPAAAPGAAPAPTAAPSAPADLRSAPVPAEPEPPTPAKSAEPPPAPAPRKPARSVPKSTVVKADPAPKEPAKAALKPASPPPAPKPTATGGVLKFGGRK